MEIQATANHSKWQRVVLLFILAYEGLGGLLGGTLLVVAPDGRLMDMPISIMHGVFSNFFIPGLILTGMGLLTTISFFEVLRKGRAAWLMAGLSLVGFAIWFGVEIAILQTVHWLHIMWGIPVLIGIWTALPLLPKNTHFAKSVTR